MKSINPGFLQQLCIYGKLLLIVFNKKGKETFVCDSSQMLLGYQAREVISMSVFKILDPQNKIFFQESLQKMIQGEEKQAIYVELLMKHRSGKPVMLGGHFFRTTDINQQECICLLASDISRHRQTDQKQQNDIKTDKELSRIKVEVREQERKTIAASIHDDIGQFMTALKLELGLIDTNHDTARQLQKKIDKSMKLIDEAAFKTQRLSYELRHVLIDNLDITSAIKKYCTDWSERTGIKTDLTIESFILNDKISLAIFRIIQEALTNVARHAQATSVRIELTHSSHAMGLIIQDNGIGIAEEHIDHMHSYGIIGMKERAEMCKGSLAMSGDNGTKIELIVPFVS